MSTGRSRLVTMLAVLLLVFAVAVPASHAKLQRMGPVSAAPSIGGYPAWFQDATGLTIEFCDPINQAELTGGWCLLLPPVPATAPETFPTNYFDEHFYWAASNVSVGTGVKVSLVLAVEAAFVNGAPAAGDQMTFGRMRITINPLPFSGDYKVIHPFGEWNFPGLVAGDRLFVTEDIGVSCPATFECTLGTSIGPYLLPSATPGGPEVPPIPDLAAGQDPFHDALVAGGGATPYPGTGKKYIADPGRIGPVTGSPLPPFVGNDGVTYNHNTLRIEGPNGFVMDLANNFSLMGRVMTGTIPGNVTVNRASYAVTATGTKLDVFANAFPTLQNREPAVPQLPLVTPVIAYYEAACGGALTIDPVTGIVTENPPPYSAPLPIPPATTVPDHPMANSGSDFWGQSTPNLFPNPPYVCVEDYTARNAAGQVVPAFYSKKITDDVSISLPGSPPAVFYDGPGGGNLTVKAGSSDPLAILSLAGFGPGGTGLDLVGGTATATGLAAPPAKVQVVSSKGGSAELLVTTAIGAAALAGVPVAVSDDVPAMFEDCSSTSAPSCAVGNPTQPFLLIDPLANDTVGGTPIRSSGITPITVTITTAPRIGTMVLNPDNTINYTPNPNANGIEGIGYTVTVGTQTSGQSYITIPITPVNDAPVANPDSSTAIANLATTLNVTSNDTDPDGAADIAAVANVSAVTPAAGTLGTGTATAVGKTVSFTGTAPGIYSFTYQAQDAAGAQSNPTTVTVTVSAAETLVIQAAQFTRNGGRYRVNGTIAPAAGQTIRIDLLNAAGTVLRTDTVVSTAGTWLLDLRNITLPNGANQVRATSSNGTVRTLALTVK